MNLRSQNRQFPTWVGYLVAVALEVAVTAILLLIQPYLPLGAYPVYYFLTTMVVAYYFGAGPAILAVVIGLFTYGYFFTPPVRTLFPLAETPAGWAGIIAYIMGTSLVAVATVLIRRSKRRVECVAELLQAIIDNIPVYIVIRDGQLRQFTFNDAFRKDMGWTEADAAEDDFMEKAYPDPEYRRQVEGYMQSLQSGFRDLKTTAKDGRQVDISWANVHLSGDRSVGIGVNISDRKKAEEALAARAREVQEANEQLAAANEELAVTNEELECTTEELRREAEERKRAEQREHEREEEKTLFYRRTIEAATNGKLIITELPEIEKLAGSSIASWEIHGPEELSEIRHGIAAMAESESMDKAQVGKFILSTGEAITNALKHAGKGTASLHRMDDNLILVVSDKGPGITALSLPEIALREGYSTAGTLGMGYKVMIGLSDKVYLATGPEGTTIGLEMDLHPAEKQPTSSLLESAPFFGDIQTADGGKE